jgi:hypothetical protein
MQSTTVNELLSNGFTEDPRAVKALQRSFAAAWIVGVGSFVLAFALFMLSKVSIGLAFWLMAGSWCFLLLTAVCMYRSRPRSPYTGKPLLKYKNQSPDSGVMVELIYVCPDSKTFSRRVYLQGGAGHGGGT